MGIIFRAIVLGMCIAPAFSGVMGCGPQQNSSTLLRLPTELRGLIALALISNKHAVKDSQRYLQIFFQTCHAVGKLARDEKFIGPLLMKFRTVYPQHFSSLFAVVAARNFSKATEWFIDEAGRNEILKQETVGVILGYEKQLARISIPPNVRELIAQCQKTSIITPEQEAPVLEELLRSWPLE